MWFKLVAIAAVFLGEVLAIGAEMWGSKYAGSERPHILFALLMVPMIIGGAFLLFGYMYGYLHLKNIWLITAMSVASIVVVEPILAYMLFQQVPTTGSVVGLSLGFAGIVAVLVLP